MSAAPRVEPLKNGRWKISWPDGERWRKVTIGEDWLDSYKPESDNPRLLYRNGVAFAEPRFPPQVSAALEALRQNRDTWEKY